MNGLNPPGMNLPRLQAMLAASPMIIALALLGLVLAYWSLQWLTPRPIPAARVAAMSAATAPAARQLFGISLRGPSGGPASTVAIKLLGIIADSDINHSYALLQISGKETLAAHLGESIAPGIRLAEIHEKKIVLDRDGVLETLSLPEKNSITGSVPHG